jgi:hypothetical protein
MANSLFFYLVRAVYCPKNNCTSFILKGLMKSSLTGFASVYQSNSYHPYSIPLSAEHEFDEFFANCG